VKVCKGKDKGTPSKGSAENGSENKSHRSQHRKLISTIPDIVDSVWLIPKSIAMETKHVDDVGINGGVCEIARHICRYLLILQSLNLH
jgi:hypothetical protein